MVGPADAWKPAWKRTFLTRKRGVLLEGSMHLFHEFARREVSNKANEVPLRRIQRTQGRRIFLASFLLTVVSDRLQADGGHHGLVRPTAAPRIDHAAHSARLEMRRFLVGERHEPYRP